ncbi:MAG TPA: ATP-binding protein [Candidatus Saccharimonadales bacterium]|nr:ATP-binding protein [Candidatus Saccharimonadales bacterium]
MNDKQIADIIDIYYAQLANKDTRQPKRVVLFSGVPGSGKSTIARAIERNLRAVRISNDEIRDRIMAAAPTIQPDVREKIKFKVGTGVMTRLARETSGLIVVDASCDRGFDEYNGWAERNGYRVVLLRMQVSRSVIEERIQKRDNQGRRNVSRSLGMLDTWWQQWEKFGKTHTPDLIIRPDTSVEEVFKIVTMA